MKSPLVYYISSHGNGHAVRSCDILRAFHEQHPDVPLILVSGVPQSFLSERMRSAPFSYRAHVMDSGLMQIDALREDIEATLVTALRLRSDREKHITEESRFLLSVQARAVVCDIPAVPLEAAARVGIPRLAVGNFGWDWMYRHFADRDARWEAIAADYAEGYARADLLLRLPFHEPMTAFPRRTDLPLVARPGRPCRAEIARHCGAPPDARWVLLAMTSVEWTADALARMNAVDGYAYLVPAPSRWKGARMYAVDTGRIPFPDVLASCDAVLSKPGFGILSECAVSEIPLAYAVRPDYPETSILNPAVKRHLRGAPLPLDALYAGEVCPAVEAAMAAPSPPDPLAAGGALIAAHHIAGVSRTVM